MSKVILVRGRQGIGKSTIIRQMMNDKTLYSDAISLEVGSIKELNSLLNDGKNDFCFVESNSLTQKDLKKNKIKENPNLIKEVYVS